MLNASILGFPAGLCPKGPGPYRALGPIGPRAKGPIWAHGPGLGPKNRLPPRWPLRPSGVWALWPLGPMGPVPHEPSCALWALPYGPPWPVRPVSYEPSWAPWALGLMGSPGLWALNPMGPPGPFWPWARCALLGPMGPGPYRPSWAMWALCPPRLTWRDKVVFHAKVA